MPRMESNRMLSDNDSANVGIAWAFQNMACSSCVALMPETQPRVVLDSVDDAYLDFGSSWFLFSIRTQRYGLRFHLVFLRFSIAIRLSECFSSSGGIVARCTWRCMSGKTIVLGGRLRARASNCFAAISSFFSPCAYLPLGEHRVPVLHTDTSGMRSCSRLFFAMLLFSGCGVNDEGASVFQTCLCRLLWPTECISCSRMRNAMWAEGVILLHLA